MYKPKYEFSLQRTYGDNYYCSCSCRFDENGNSKVMHNEIGFNFTYKNRKIVVKDGWHIGTSDFDFGGTDNNSIVDDYNPGLLTRLREYLKTHKLEEDKSVLRERKNAERLIDTIYYHVALNCQDKTIDSIKDNETLITRVRNCLLELQTFDKTESNYEKCSFEATFDYYKSLGE